MECTSRIYTGNSIISPQTAFPTCHATGLWSMNQDIILDALQRVRPRSGKDGLLEPTLQGLAQGPPRAPGPEQPSTPRCTRRPRAPPAPRGRSSTSGRSRTSWARCAHRLVAAAPKKRGRPPALPSLDAASASFLAPSLADQCESILCDICRLCISVRSTVCIAAMFTLVWNTVCMMPRNSSHSISPSHGPYRYSDTAQHSSARRTTDKLHRAAAERPRRPRPGRAVAVVVGVGDQLPGHAQRLDVAGPHVGEHR
jgi:hypothetical protein